MGTRSNLTCYLRLLLASFLLSCSAACSVGPDYVRPSVDTQPAFKEGQGWKQARMEYTTIAEKWWELFGDPQLNALAEQVTVSNQNIAVAEASFRQARALLDGSRAGYYPTVSIGPSATRSKSSGNISTYSSNYRGTTRNDFNLPANLTWEIDVWGRIRRSVEAAQAGLYASEADLASARLSAQAAMASAYFQLRAVDAQKSCLEETIVSYKKTLEMAQNRYAAGVVSRVDVFQAETQLKSTQAQLVELGVQRAQLEHAIALLAGKPPGVFSIVPLPLAGTPPAIPLLLPSELLERRPDIVSAERRMAAANAGVGVARAAYYPTVKLGASFGFEASDIAKWFAWPSHLWSFGPTVTETIFDGGLRRSQNRQAEAVYDGAVAAYRQTVLGAFVEVEDNLAALRLLEEEGRVQDEAVIAARRSLDAISNQYRAGVVSYLNVITAQTAELSNRRSAIAIQGRRMTAAVLLVKALGGGWRTDSKGEDKSVKQGRGVSAKAE